MNRRFPGKYDRNWVKVWVLSTVVFWGFWNLSQLLILHKFPSSGGLLGILLLGMASSFVFCIAGFLGMKILWYSGWIGIGTGLSLNLFFCFRGGGWEDLAGLVAYIEFTVLGTMLGMVGEVIKKVAHKKRK